MWLLRLQCPMLVVGMVGGIILAASSGGCRSGGRERVEVSPPRVDDQTFRQRDEALAGAFDAARAECDRRWAVDDECLRRLRQLAVEECELIAAVRRHRFHDLTEHHYWHRGRAKFPSPIAAVLAATASAGPEPVAGPAAGHPTDWPCRMDR